MDIDKLHKDILYPIVRVRAKTSGGSGVLAYSAPDPKDPDRFINLVYTCSHVIDNLITLKDDWDPVLKRQMKKEFIEEATVEVFDYDESKLVSSNATQADVIAYDKHHDVAVVRLHNHRPMLHVASLIPKESIEHLRIGDGVTVCGCSLLHDPFPNHGTLTYLREIIEQKAYLMVNAPSIFGNSGGGLFHESGHLLGLTSRITGIQVGFGIDIMTWMGFSTHPNRMYEFLDNQELQFMYDSSDDYYSAMDRRQKKREEALRHMLLGEGSDPVLPAETAPETPPPEGNVETMIHLSARRRSYVDFPPGL